jgi:hypothetical protein
LLLAAVLPGLGEVVENAMHLVLEGHLAHAAPVGDEHGPPSPEHGCSGTLHLCQCCISPSFAPVNVAGATRQEADRGAVIQPSSVLHDAFLQDIEHPPRA